jgi:hypothetical protein
LLGGAYKMKSIQEYIDERPVWPDGTQISGAPMTSMQWLIWMLAAIVPSETNEGYLDTVHFIPLPTQIWALSETQIQSIK